MRLSGLSAAGISFLVFFTGIALGIAVFPTVRPVLPDDRLFAFLVLVYLLGVRFAGRMAARAWARQGDAD